MTAIEMALVGQRLTASGEGYATTGRITRVGGLSEVNQDLRPRLLTRQLEACRWQWNTLLAERKQAWEEQRETVDYYEQETSASSPNRRPHCVLVTLQDRCRTGAGQEPLTDQAPSIRAGETQRRGLAYPGHTWGTEDAGMEHSS
jgi:hypothetical protein